MVLKKYDQLNNCNHAIYFGFIYIMLIYTWKERIYVMKNMLIQMISRISLLQV